MRYILPLRQNIALSLVYSMPGGGDELTNLQMIEALCNLVEQQSRLIRKLAFALAEADCLTAEEQRAVQEMQNEYSTILDADEVPDNLSE